MDDRIILLVEDNPSDIDLTLRAFEKSRIRNPVVVAHDGQEALDLLLGPEATGPTPAIILLDLKLPKVDGLEVLRRVREDGRTSRLPVVILTSSDEQPDLAESYDRGANSYIRKPVDFNQFAEAVKQLGLYWLVLNVPQPAD
jgi:CheY-like chemotaxis protein